MRIRNILWDNKTIVSTVKVTKGIYDSMVFPLDESFSFMLTTYHEINYSDELAHEVSSSFIEALKTHYKLYKKFKRYTRWNIRDMRYYV